MKEKKKVIFGILISSFIVFLILEIYFAFKYLYNICIGRGNKMVMLRLLDLKNEVDVISNIFEEERLKIRKWLNTTFVKGLKTKGLDKTLLFGQWFIKENSKKWIIIAHGYGIRGDFMLYMAKKFHKFGYNVLLPDLRGHGLSGGEYIGMGWYDRLDIIKWINKVIEKDSEAKIVLYGMSMGASTMLMASGEKLPDNVKCIVSDCAYTSAYEVIKHQLGQIKSIQPFIFTNILSFVCKYKNGYSFREASALKQVRKNKIPIFFIHGDSDKFVPTQMLFKLYKNANCKKEIMLIKNARHGTSSVIDKENYFKRVSIFMDKYC